MVGWKNDCADALPSSHCPSLSPQRVGGGRMKRQLGETGILLERIVENLPDMIFVKDAADLRFIRFNAAGERLLGYPRDALIGKNDYDFFTAEAADTFTGNDRLVLAGDEVVDIEEPIETREHGLRWLHTKKIPIRDEEGQPLYLLGISRDITELRDAGLALVEREGRLRRVLEHFPGAVWTTDEALRITWIGGALVQTLAPKADALVGQDVGAALRGDVDLRPHHQAALDGTPGASAFCVGDREFEVHLERIEDPTPGVMGVALDVTLRRRLDAVQVEVQVQRAQRMESLGVLAGGIAHDFNNLLVGMVGNASLALLKLPFGAPGRAEVERLVVAADRAADLTGQMLAYSGKGRFVVEPVDVSALVRETAELARSLFSERARLEVDAGARLPAVAADATQLRRVVMNLMVNAADSLPVAGGDVRVQVTAARVGAAHVRDAHGDGELAAGSYVCIDVSDSGCGMDERTRRRMFDPFFTTKPNGHGLGLAATVGIVRGHRGAIKVYSEVGRGTTVRVFLPISSVAPAEVTAASSGAVLPRGLTVLVVDDEEAVRDLARAVLEHHGIEVLEAEDGESALALYAEAKDRVGLVLLDLTMPGLDGEETFHGLQRLRPAVRVVLSSGYNEQQATGRFGGLGLAGFLRKPYRAEQLLTMVRGELGTQTSDL